MKATLWTDVNFTFAQKLNILFHKKSRLVFLDAKITFDNIPHGKAAEDVRINEETQN